MKKNYCHECIYFKYVDGDGLGYCMLMEAADVDIHDLACVEVQEKEE